MIRIAGLAAVVLLSLNGQEPGRTARPEVTLMVRPLSLKLAQRQGAGSFTVDATASGGFSGTISGSITVSEPVNGDRIKLMAGAGPKTFAFRLGAGQNVSGAQPNSSLIFKVETSPSNDRGGVLVYTVSLDPSNQFTTTDPVRQVRIVVGDQKCDAVRRSRLGCGDIIRCI
jgi:hypothetical protein